MSNVFGHVCASAVALILRLIVSCRRHMFRQALDIRVEECDMVDPKKQSYAFITEHFDKQVRHFWRTFEEVSQQQSDEGLHFYSLP